jgi:hypothetical protein
MGCLKLTYYEQGNALEVNSNFFGEALEKKGYSDFFRLKAYTYGFNGLIKGMREAGVPYSEIPKNLISTSMSDPVGEAVQEGYMQEKMDQYGPTYSAYSYEDLPSDKFGADFSVNYFDPNSESSFGEQLQNYLNNVLGATNPENAPNYENLPTEYPVKGELPSVQNRTTEPMFIKE